jgi:hypothetical protein
MWCSEEEAHAQIFLFFPRARELANDEPTNDQDQGQETTTLKRRPLPEEKEKEGHESKITFFTDAPNSYSLLFFLKRSALARGNLQITTRRRYVRALYIHTHTRTRIYI